MAFTSLDTMVSAMASGQSLMCPYNKITGAAAYTAGRWYNLFTLTGQPVAGTYTGTSLAMQTCTDAFAGAWYHGGNKSPSIKNLLNLETIVNSTTGFPGYLLLVDMLAYYPGINLNSGSQQNFTGSAAGANILPNRNGVQHTGTNVYPFIEIASTIGATPSTVAMTYTNQAASASGRTLGATVNYLASGITPQILYSGASAGNYGPFLPLQTGDYGVSSVQNVTIGASGSASTGTLILCEPLAKIPLTSQYTPIARDFLFNIPSLPIIKDGACLTFLYYAGAACAASTSFTAFMDVAWG